MLAVDPTRRPKVSQILKRPFMTSRIRAFLTESVRMDEFSHTVLHKQDLFDAAAVKREETNRKQKAEQQAAEMKRQ